MRQKNLLSLTRALLAAACRVLTAQRFLDYLWVMTFSEDGTMAAIKTTEDASALRSIFIPGINVEGERGSIPQNCEPAFRAEPIEESAEMYALTCYLHRYDTGVPVLTVLVPAVMEEFTNGIRNHPRVRAFMTHVRPR